MKNILYKYVIPPIAFVLLYCISLTMRMRVINRKMEEQCEERGRNRIYSFWHGRFFYFPYFCRWKSQYVILVSPSIDGEIISRTLQMFGFSTIRGSSYKSGREAFWKLARVLKDGKSIVMIGDGSRGPKHTLQSGIVYMAKISGVPIVPVSYSARHKKSFSTWDSFMLPCPFTEGVLIYGDPVHVRKDDAIEARRVEVEERLNEITERADGYFS